MMIDRFAHKAESYEQNRNRVENVENIARAIQHSIELRSSMHIMDFGSGTGLLLEQIAPHVGKIIAVDVSPSMNTQLREKQSRLPCETEILEIDLERVEIEGQFDGIVSSMTMHHIRDVAAMFRRFYGMVKAGGFIAIADLDLEDGSFHTEDTGVFHTGFDRAAIATLATDAGFWSVAVSSASVIRKPQGDYGVFLLTGIR